LILIIQLLAQTIRQKFAVEMLLRLENSAVKSANIVYESTDNLLRVFHFTGKNDSFEISFRLCIFNLLFLL